jgi:hypothetical protein
MGMSSRTSNSYGQGGLTPIEGPKIEMEDHKMYFGKRDLWPIVVRASFKPSHST